MVPVRVTATACWIGSTSSSSSGVDVDISSWLLTSRPREPSADWISGAWKSLVGEEELPPSGRRARSGVSIPVQKMERFIIAFSFLFFFNL